MPYDLADIFGILGLSFCSYIVGQVFKNLSLLCEDSGKSAVLSYVFAALFIVFSWIGFPVSIAVLLAHSYPNRRAQEIAAKEAAREESEKMERICESRVRTAVAEERNRMEQACKERIRMTAEAEHFRARQIYMKLLNEKREEKEEENARP